MVAVRLTATVKQFMRIAILGAGYAGIATAWHLARKGAVVTVYDPAGIAGGASGMAAGLLHPYMGLDAKKAWRSDEALQCTHRLLQEAQPHAPSTIIRSQGIVRLAYSERQRNSFYLCSQQHEEVTWWEPHQTSSHLPAVNPTSAIFIQGGWSIDSKAYVTALWEVCKGLNCIFIPERKTIEDVSKLYDAVVVAAGYASKNLLLSTDLALRPFKGQLVQLRWPKHLPPLHYPVNSHVYIVMSSDNKTCLVGAPYEKMNNVRVDLAAAWEELKPKVAKISPDLANQKPLKGWAGVRCSTPQHRPIIGQASNNLWFLTGLGSRGLLYHGLYARDLTKLILESE